MYTLFQTLKHQRAYICLKSRRPRPHINVLTDSHRWKPKILRISRRKTHAKQFTLVAMLVFTEDSNNWRRRAISHSVRLFILNASVSELLIIFNDNCLAVDLVITISCKVSCDWLFVVMVRAALEKSPRRETMESAVLESLTDPKWPVGIQACIWVF